MVMVYPAWFDTQKNTLAKKKTTTLPPTTFAAYNPAYGNPFRTTFEHNTRTQNGDDGKVQLLTTRRSFVTAFADGVQT
jgi:hypothetical protein